MLDVHVAGGPLLDDVDAQLPALADRVGALWDGLEADRSAAAAARRPAFVPIWRRPWMALGPDTYGASLLAASGIAVVPADARSATPRSTESLRGALDVVLAPDEPYRFTDATSSSSRRSRRRCGVDGKDLFWWGERTRRALARFRDPDGIRLSWSDPT